MIILSGSSNLPLARSIASNLGLPLPTSSTCHFSNGETCFTLPCSVRSQAVFLIQSGYSGSRESPSSPDEFLMELCMMVRACREASAERITCVIPCFPYSVDRDVDVDADEDDSTYKKWKAKPGKLISNLLQVSGADQVLCLDLHHPQYQGFFDVPLDNIQCTQLAIDAFKQWSTQAQEKEKVIVMSPDVGGSKRALNLSSLLQIPFVALSPPSLLGSLPIDQAFSVFLLDDLMDTGAKLSWALNYLLQQSKSLKRIGIFLTHALFSTGCFDRLRGDAQLASSAGVSIHLYLTDSVQQDQQVLKRLQADGCFTQVKVIGVAPLLAETINRLQHGQSISSMW